MVTQTKSVETKKTSAKPTITKPSKKHDAINQLIADHAKVKKLFKQFKTLSDKDDIEGKSQVVNEICVELTVHALAEEEVFYTAVRPMIHDDDLLNEANIEHDSAKDLIAQIQSMSPEDPMYDARVTVLGEYIVHHVGEEEEEMFPKVRKTKVDLAKLDDELTARKTSLKAGLIDTDGSINVKALKAASEKALATKH